MHQGSESGKLVSIQVARPQTFGDDEGEWTTGFFKQPISGAVFVTETNIEGDGQADLQHHGGVDKAVLAYAASHYPTWSTELGVQMHHGAFGENLTIDGLDERTVCVGDQWEIGNVILEVSQPRQPCWKLGRRWNNKLLPKLVVQNGRSGWYFRVLQVGSIQSSVDVLLLDRPHPAWTIKRANDVFYRGAADEQAALASVAKLSDAWKKELS